MTASSPLVLVTGGAGYIGSHTCVELLAAGWRVAVVDNFSNSKPAVVERIQRIAGREVQLVKADLRDTVAMNDLFARHPIQAVVHFAGLKAVGESVSEPLRYYDNNVGGTLSLLAAMHHAGCRHMVFSSSATVYGAAGALHEDDPIRPVNPYGATKATIERILQDLAASDDAWRIALLRYFNPVGAHESGLIGEDPDGIPNNLMPYMAQVAIGRRERLTIFGDDYPTRDGTGERDYIHVVDLARGHLAALHALPKLHGAEAFNLGTGCSVSVLELLRAFEIASGRPIPYSIGPRRPGDLPCYYADPARAAERLGWRAGLGLDRMCADTWRWQEANPNGY